MAVPITYTTDVQRRVVLTTWTGLVSVDEVRAHWIALFEDPEVVSAKRILADLTGASVMFAGAELARLLRDIVAPRVKGERWVNALVVARPDQYGSSRQFSTFNEQLGSDAIFFDRDEAIAWILTQ